MPATNRAGHRRGPRPAATVAGLAIALTGLAGCDRSDDGDSETTATQPRPAQGSADPRVVKRIPLRSTANQVVAQIGRPARIDRARSQTCYLYDVTGGRPTDRIRMCFVDGKLFNVLTTTATK